MSLCLSLYNTALASPETNSLVGLHRTAESTATIFDLTCLLLYSEDADEDSLYTYQYQFISEYFDLATEFSQQYCEMIIYQKKNVLTTIYALVTRVIDFRLPLNRR